MALNQRAPYSAQDSQRIAEDVSEQDEEAMANDFREQVQFDDSMSDLERTNSMGGAMADMQQQLLAAATPLEYQASLETKFASYDSYCNLFHYILNSEGPVDIEVPSVSSLCYSKSGVILILSLAILGLGCYRRVHLSVRVLLQIPKPRCPNKSRRRRCPAP